MTTEDTIALFPQEWQRDPASPLIRSAYHDVPWDAPALVRAYINQRPGLRVLTHQFWRERRQRKQTSKLPLFRDGSAAPLARRSETDRRHRVITPGAPEL